MPELIASEIFTGFPKPYLAMSLAFDKCIIVTFAERVTSLLIDVVVVV